MPQVQRATDEVADLVESSFEGDIFRYRGFWSELGLLKRCISELETDKDITPLRTSVSSFCTYLFRYNEVPPIREYSMADEFEGNRNFLRLEIETAPLEFDWLSFCGNLFPETRGYTEEERKVYLNFINSFFETIEI